jgi:hypothetical protein
VTAPIAVLVSYHFWRDLDLDEHFARWPTHPVVFADSGAFSAFTSGAVVDVHEYAAWLDRWRHHFAVACTLDVIHDEVATEANTAILEDHGHRVLPVFHTQEPWEYLERLCDRYPYVGLGGMVPFKIRRNALARWLVKCFRTGVADGTVFHGLGLTSPDLLALLPFYSVDSSGWCEGLQYGKVRVFDPLRARPRVVQAGDRRALLHGEAFRAVGVDPHALATPYFGRRHPDGNKPVEQARAEADLEGAANIASTWQHAEWWHARHAPVALDGMPDGPVMFLVAINPRDLSRIREHFYPTTDTQEAQHDGATSPA